MPRADTWGRFDWPGQGLAIDLADTIVVVRPGETIDHLATSEQLLRWLELERPWLGEAHGDALERLDDFRALREAIRALCFATVRGDPPPSEAAPAVNRFSAAAPWFRQLEVAQGEPPRVAVASTVPDGTDRLLATIADAAVGLLGGPDHKRLRVCPAPSCGMFFLAGSPRQLWCRDLCGNRARVGRHHARVAASGGAPERNGRSPQQADMAPGPGY